MKITLAILFASTLLASGQFRPAIIYTNDANERVVSFTNLAGQKFIAVTLRRPTARGLVWAQEDKDGAITGGGTVAYTNIHPAILKLFKITPVEPPAPQPVVATAPAAPVEWQQVKILNIVEDIATWQKCETSVGTVLMQVPARTAEWFAVKVDLQARQDSLNPARAFSQQAGGRAAAANAALQAAGPSTPYGPVKPGYYDAAHVRYAANWQKEHNDQALSAAQSSLQPEQAFLRQQKGEATTVQARPSGKTYAGLPIWTCK